MKKFGITLIVTAALVLAAGLVGCTRSGGVADRGKPLVAVSILPQKYLAERIAAGRVGVLVIVGEGQSPHSYEPTPRQLEALSRASVWILSGTDFEQSLEPKIRALYPKLPVVDGTAGVAFRPLEAHEHDDAVHGGLELDRHTWLGREPAKTMAGHILAALEAADPAGGTVYREAHAALVADIDAVFDELSATLAPLRGKNVLVFHPAFGYFLDEFGIRQVSVETGGKEPTPKALAALVAEAREEGARAIFVQAQFPADSARSLAESLGAQVLALDPLAADWLGNIRAMGQTLSRVAGATE